MQVCMHKNTKSGHFHPFYRYFVMPKKFRISQLFLSGLTNCPARCLIAKTPVLWRDQCHAKSVFVCLQRLDYQNQLEKKRREEEMAYQKALQDEQLRKQEESVAKQEKMRRGKCFLMLC